MQDSLTNALSEAILANNLLEVEQLVASGAKINLLDNYGFCPITHAVANNNYAITDLLIKHGAKLDIIDTTGATLIHWAVDKNDYHMAEILLKHGANPNAYNIAGQPPLFYPIIRKNIELQKLLINKGADFEYARDYILAKAIGHRFELRGETDLVTPGGMFNPINLEGFYLEFTLDELKNSINRYINSYSAKRENIPKVYFNKISDALDNACLLRQYRHFSVEIAKHLEPINNLLENDLLLLPVSYQGHAINFIKYQDYFAKCDRGVKKNTDPILINHIGNLELVNDQFLSHLLYDKHTEIYIKHGLPQKLALEQFASLPIRHQITGNCSWANSEASIPTMLFMLLYAKRPNIDLKKLTRYVMHFYKNWQNWDKDRAIEDCLIGFEKLPLKRQQSRAALLGVVLFQALSYEDENDVARANKIIHILTQKQFKYIIQAFSKVYLRSRHPKRLVIHKLFSQNGFNVNNYLY